MRHRHPPISRETPTLCTAQSRGFVFILRSLAPSARAVASKVEHHRKPMAMLSLPSAIYAPEIERMWSVQAAVQIAQRLDVGQIESVELVVCAIQFVQFVIVVTSSEVSRFCEPSSSFASRSAFFEELAVSPKSCAVRVEISGFFSRRCGAASHLSVLSRHSAWWCAKKSPAVCLTAGECRLWHAPQGAWRGAGLALGAGAPCPVRNAIYLFSLGRIEWCRADPDLACFYCKGRNPRSNYLRLRS